jgi:trehalose 6-phosphate synthase
MSSIGHFFSDSSFQLGRFDASGPDLRAKITEVNSGECTVAGIPVSPYLRSSSRTAPGRGAISLVTERMKPLVRFIVLLVALLALLAWGMSRIVNDTTQAWFEKDIALRAVLAVNGARTSLMRNWPTEPGAGDRQLVRAILDDITHDERILAAAACNVDGTLIAATDDYPDSVSCIDLAARVDERSTLGEDPEFSAVGVDVQLPTGPAHVSAIRIADAGKPLGCVVLIHDLSFVARREARAQTLILAAFALLAICASLTTLVAARLAWRGWTKQVVRFIRGGTSRSEFQPIMRDVRELIERISAERALDAEGGAWTPQRLKHTLTQHLHGERVIMLANREPYVHNRTADGAISVLHPASGLVTALEPVMRACSGVWVAHGSGSADRETVDAHDRVRVPPGEESYEIAACGSPRRTRPGYYYGFSNEGLWPLCHVAHARPTFRRRIGSGTEGQPEVRRRRLRRGRRRRRPHRLRAGLSLRARAAHDPRAPAAGDDHHVLAHPLAERRALRHLPVARRAPRRPARLEHRRVPHAAHCNNFLDAVDRYLESRVDREHRRRGAARARGARASVSHLDRMAEPLAGALPAAAECRARCSTSSARPDALLGVGVDRIDYTKGIEERLLAVERAARALHPSSSAVSLRPARGAEPHGDRAYQPSSTRRSRRSRSTHQRALRHRTCTSPIVLLRAHHEPATVFRYFRAADLCYVSSLHDGMNLVAKEFVAAATTSAGCSC